MGVKTSLWRALVSSMADTLYEVSGRVLAVVASDFTGGGGTLNIEGSFRFPDAGKVAVNGEIGTYTGKTVTPTVTALTGVTGLTEDISTGAVVMDWSKATTQLDDLRSSFLTHLAVSDQLDTLARNFGINRPRGLGDASFRDALRALIYLDATTIYACEKILDAVIGVGNYTLYEDLVSDIHRVHVVLTAAPLSQYQGKAYLVGAEAQARDNATQVTADYTPVEVYGIWDSADPFREGTNYALGTFACYTEAADPTYLKSAAAIFTSAMVGDPVFLGVYGHWTITGYIDPNTVQLGWPMQSDGSLRSWAPLTLTTDGSWFPAWVSATTATVTITNAGANSGSYDITTRDSKRLLTLAAAAFSTASDVEWTLRPKFGTVAAVSADLPAWTSVAKVITVPGPLPANVLLDYTTVPSAQIQGGPSVDGNSAYPLYLWDQGAVIAALLDLVTAAGVEVVVETA